ncbi:MAG: SDR family oxidoreductase [Chitinophagaceae bacterium]|nr:SDR family oxidoreductase [Chitinophagaceae bacterium]
MNILVTGGASGIGEAITRKFAEEEGNKVYFTYNRSAERAISITNNLLNTRAIHCDFESDSSLEVLCNMMNEMEIDVLINNAYTGNYLNKHFHKTAANDFLVDFTRNVLPVIRITQAAIFFFRTKKSGKIVTISTAALIGSPPVGSSQYVANKAYLEQMSKCWAAENSKFNISSVILSPSFVLTGMTGKLDERIIEQLIQDNPLKRLLTKEEVANAVYKLAHTSESVSGRSIVLNAGESINLQQAF